jgi:hypothetical protein
MRLLFNDRLAPITETIGFLEAPMHAAVQAFVEWQRTIHERLGRTIAQQPLSGSLEQHLLALLPLTSVLRERYLFLPTASPWIAYVDNGHQGTDAFSTMSFLAQRLGCRGLRVTAAPDTIEGEFRGARGRYGGLVLEVYGPEPTHFLNYVRSISLVNDGGRWDFNQGGTPFPFERLESYSARRQRDRFTSEMLESYLSALGLSPFEEGFYLPRAGEGGILVEQSGTRPEGMRDFTLAEARADF